MRAQASHATRTGPAGTRDHRRILGRAGENTAARILHEAGLVVTDRNWRAGRSGELDLIALDGRTTVIVEVRTRIGDRLGTALESVDSRKIARLRRLAAQWAGQARGRGPITIDVIALSLPASAREEALRAGEDADLRELGARVSWIRAVA